MKVMKTATVYMDGDNQVVLLPEEFRFPGTDVCVRKVGHAVMLYSEDHAPKIVKEDLSDFTDDFFTEGRGGPGESASGEPL